MAIESKSRPSAFKLRKVNQSQDSSSIDEKIKSLGRLTKNKRARKKISRNKDTIRTLLDSLTTKPKFTKMVEYSVDCLKNLAVDEMAVEEMIDEGTIDVLQRVMQLNPYNEKIQRAVNATIAAFCKNERLSKLIQEKLGTKQIIHSLKKHVEPDTLVSTTSALGGLMKEPENVHSFVTAGVIPSLAHVVTNNSENEDVITGCAKVLSVISQFPEHRAAIMETGCLSALISSIQHYGANDDVSYTLGLVANLTSTTEAAQEIKDLGAVEVLVSALEFHPDNQNILDLAGQCFTSLTDINDTVAVLAVDPTACNAILAHAVSTYASLALVTENVEYFHANGGVAWVVQAMTAAESQDDEHAMKVITQGLLSLQRMAIDEKKIYGVMTAGGVAAILSSTKAKINDENIVCAGMNALASMLTRKENGDYLVKSGALALITEIMNAHPDSLRVNSKAMEFYNKMALHSSGVNSLFEQKVEGVISKCIAKFTNDKPLCVQALSAFGRMSNSHLHLATVIAARGLEPVVKILNQQRSDPEIAALCMQLFASAAVDPNNHEYLKGIGVVDSILETLEIHPDNAKLAEIGALALDYISGANKQDEFQEAVGTVMTITRKMAGSSTPMVMTGELNAIVSKIGNLLYIDGNIELLYNAGAVDALVAAICTCETMEGEETQDLLIDGAVALVRMAEDEKLGADVCGIIVRKGGLRSLLKSALAQADNPDLALVTAKLTDLCCSHLALHEQMLTDGVIRDLLQIAKNNPGDDAILKHVVSALSKLCSSDEIAQSMVDLGACDVAVESLRVNLDDPVAVMQALELIGKLAINDEAIQRLLAAGVIDAILSALRRYPDHQDIVHGCVSNLTRLLISEDVAIEIGDKGGIPLLTKAMRTHYKIEDIAESDMVLLDSLASVEKCLSLLLDVELDTENLVVWIMEAYGVNEMIQESGERLLAALRAVQEYKDKLIAIATNASINDAEAQTMVSDATSSVSQLQELSGLVQNPANAAMLLQTGGLHTLADLMRDQEDASCFYEASDCFLAMLDAAGDDMSQYVNDPNMVNALCSMINASENYDSAMDLNALSKAIAACSKLKLKGAVLEGLIKGDPFDALMKILSSSDDAELLTQAARLLGKLSNKDKIAALLADLANLRALIAAMRRNIANEDFLKYGVYLLGNLALDDTLKSQIGTEGGVSLIVQIMEMYGGNEALVENSLYALANLSFQNPVNNRFIVSGNGIDLLCSVIATYTTNEELLESGVCVLCNLCYGSDSNKESICHAGGASVIADVVLNNFNADDLLITCFRTLGNLAFNASNVAIIVKAGGVQGIVAGMTVHSENLDIVDVAIRVLTNLAAAADTESMKIMSSEGAVQAIIEGAQTYDDNLRLSVGSYGCLWTLAREPTNATMMVKQHAQKAVISSFNKLGFDENLCDKGLRLIAVLTSHNSNLRRLEKSGIVSAIVTSMSAHSGNQYIVSSGLVCLARLAFGEQAALKMEEECKVVKLVLGIFKAGVGDPHIVNECFAALGGICRAAANAGKMATAAFTLCAKAVQNHIQNVPVVSHAFVFVSNLAVHKEASSVADQSPIVSAILVGMRQHRVDPSVLIRGCHALENIAYGPKQVKEHLKTEGVLDAMHQVREENAANDDVCIAAQSVIDAINRDDDLVQRQYVSMKPADLGKRSARDIFGDSKEGKNVVMELPNKIRNFLCAGALLSKHSNSAKPRPRHVYVTTDLKYFIWKDPKKQLKPENKMKVIRMREVERGRCTKQLQRKKFGSFLAKEEGAFAVRGKDRTVDLEAPSEGDREKWVNALQMLIDYTKYQKSVNKLFTSR